MSLRVTHASVSKKIPKHLSQSTEFSFLLPISNYHPTSPSQVNLSITLSITEKQTSTTMPDNSTNPPRPGVIVRAQTDTSTISTSTTSLANTKNTCRTPQFNQHGNPLDAMSRSYDAPTGALDIEHALRQPAQPGTFRYQLEQGPQAEKRVMTEEDKKAEFERVKQCLKGWGQPGKN